jgi:hypothetical protein
VKLQETLFIMSLCTAAVTGALLYMKPAYTEHLEYAFPLPYPISQNRLKVLTCSFLAGLAPSENIS